jgi:hypothetical protein
LVVASLGAVVFVNPTLLFDAQVSQSAHALDQLGQLRDQFCFQFVGSYLVNCEGFGEKWFKDRLGNWFALTPDGFNSSARNVVATLSPLVFDDPDLLFRSICPPTHWPLRRNCRNKSASMLWAALWKTSSALARSGSGPRWQLVCTCLVDALFYDDAELLFNS